MDKDKDVFDELAEQARRQKAEETAKDNIIRGRVQLIRGRRPQDAFFASLAMRFAGANTIVDWTIQTMATDGVRLYINPDFTNKLQRGKDISEDHLAGVLAHECLHPGLGHHVRRQHRHPLGWNIAADCAINQLLTNDGFALPEDRIQIGKPPYENAPPGLCAEAYYELLKDKDRNTGKSGDPGGCGGVLDAPGDPAQAKEAEAAWKSAVAQAALAAKARGTLPGGLAALVAEIVEPKVSWAEILREFIRSRARNDFTWSRPNRRFIGEGLYLPGMDSEELGEIVVAIDTSGSCYTPPVLSRFTGELQGILDGLDCKVTIMYADARVSKVVEWSSADGPLTAEHRRFPGGGGTSHKPVWSEIEKRSLQPAAIVCLTDCITEYPEHDGGFPTIWACVGNREAKPPFGQLIHVE